MRLSGTYRTLTFIYSSNIYLLSMYYILRGAIAVKSTKLRAFLKFVLLVLPQVRDLLSRIKKPGGLRVREDQQLGFYVDGLKSVPCENYAQIERLMEQGAKIRTTASTNMNASSSRSHMIITIQFKQVRFNWMPMSPPLTEGVWGCVPSSIMGWWVLWSFLDLIYGLRQLFLNTDYRVRSRRK